MTTQTDSDLILAITQQVNPHADSITNISGGYRKAKMDGDGSFYVVYSSKNYESESSNPPIIVDDSKIYKELSFDVKSARGWNKSGITLFAKPFYGGSGTTGEPATFIKTDEDITLDFPTGIQSLIVHQGKWSLHKKMVIRSLLINKMCSRLG